MPNAPGGPAQEDGHEYGFSLHFNHCSTENDHARNARRNSGLIGEVSLINRVRIPDADSIAPFPRPLTELVLAHSGYAGAPVRLNTNREFLGRTLRLGFSEIELVDAESPVVCHARDLVFCWQSLSKRRGLRAEQENLPDWQP
ncbi:hypothetical protein V5E97_03965 [Singulisphaera sp. Ch08]|uniref:Uncharacterized protein n=1 Tax=Singulisphaera sp. Ch08 TaxID=3120278 RepID=A0AAU7CJ77_9BACT